MKLKAIITGVSAALIFTLMGVLFISSWLILDQGTAYYLPGFGLLLGMISCLTGGVKSGANTSPGWWWQNGILMSIGYLAIIFLVVNLLFPTAISWEQLSNWVIITLLGVLGSLIGYYYKRIIAFRWKEKAQRRRNFHFNQE